MKPFIHKKRIQRDVGEIFEVKYEKDWYLCGAGGLFASGGTYLFIILMLPFIILLPGYINEGVLPDNSDVTLVVWLVILGIYLIIEAIRYLSRDMYAFGKKGVVKMSLFNNRLRKYKFYHYDDINLPKYRIRHENNANYMFQVYYGVMKFVYRAEILFSPNKCERIYKTDLFNYEVSHLLYKYMSLYRVGEKIDYKEPELMNTVEVEENISTDDVE